MLSLMNLKMSAMLGILDIIPNEPNDVSDVRNVKYFRDSGMSEMLGIWDVRDLGMLRI